MKGNIEIYQTPDNETEVKVRFEAETVWLTQNQLSELFETDRTSILRHLKNIYDTSELEEESTCAKFAQVQKEGTREVTRDILHYNLDAIISVGYRVNSKRGTEFRKWANKRLKDYLIQGYAVNEKRLEQKNQEIEYLKDGIKILSRNIEQLEQSRKNDWINFFSVGLNLLDDYDHENLDSDGLTLKNAKFPTLEDYQELIENMKIDFASPLFGKAKDKSFESSINQIRKGFDEEDFYPSIEEKAAMLLYLIVKNHSFVDGNKRIAAVCFLKFLDANNMLKNESGKMIISSESLAGLTLFVAASKREEMQTVKKLIVSVLNRNK